MMMTDFDQEIQREYEIKISGENKTFSKCEHDEILNAAIQKAHAEGLIKGRKEGQAEERVDIIAESNVSLQNIVPKMELILENMSQYQKDLEEQVLDFVYSILEKIFPEIINKFGTSFISNEINSTLNKCSSNSNIIIYTSERSLSEVSGLINNYLSDQKYKGQVTIEGDKNLSSGEVRVDWDNGFMSFSLPDITQNILSKFDRINSNNQI